MHGSLKITTQTKAINMYRKNIKCEHGFVVLYFVDFFQCLDDSYDLLTHIIQVCFAVTGADIWLPNTSQITLSDMGHLGQ